MMNGRRRSGGRALVTGASSDTGRALAARLADAGHDLVVVDRDPYRLDRTTRWLRRRTGVEVRPVVLDPRRPDGLGRLLSLVHRLEIGVVVHAASPRETGRALAEALRGSDVEVIPVHPDGIDGDRPGGPTPRARPGATVESGPVARPA